MNATPSTLEKKAYGLAAAQLLSFSEPYDSPEKWYDGYSYVSDKVNADQEPDDDIVLLWAPVEHYTWSEVLHEIEDQAQAFLVVVRDILNLAKAGIVHVTIENELDSDMNNLDMNHLVELGQRLEA